MISLFKESYTICAIFYDSFTTVNEKSLLRDELFSVHSPLLREYLLVSFPVFIYMLKFNTLSYYYKVIDCSITWQVSIDTCQVTMVNTCQVTMVIYVL